MRGIFSFLLAVTIQLRATDSREEFFRDLDTHYPQQWEHHGKYVIIPIPESAVSSGELAVDGNQQEASQQKKASPGYLQRFKNWFSEDSSSSDVEDDSFDDEDEGEIEENAVGQEKEFDKVIKKRKVLQKKREKNPTKEEAKEIEKIEKKSPKQLKKQGGKFYNFKDKRQKKGENTKNLKNEEEKEEEWENNNTEDEEKEVKDEGEEEEEENNSKEDEEEKCEEEPKKESTNKVDTLEDKIKCIEKDFENKEFLKASSKIKEVKGKYKMELEKQKKESPKGKSKIDDLKEKLATSNPEIYNKIFPETDENKEKKDKNSNKSLKDANKKKESETLALPWWTWVLISVGILMLLLSAVLLYCKCCYGGARDDYRDESIPDFELNVNVDHSRFRTDGTTFLAEELHQANSDMNQINSMNKEFAMFLEMDGESTQKASISEINLVSTISGKKAGDETKNAISP